MKVEQRFDMRMDSGIIQMKFDVREKEYTFSVHLDMEDLKNRNPLVYDGLEEYIEEIYRERFNLGHKESGNV